MIAARQIAFGGSKRKPYDAEIEYLKTQKSSNGRPQIDLPMMNWTHFEAELAIEESSDRKYIGSIWGETGATGLYYGCYGVVTYNDYYRGSGVFMGFAENTYKPILSKKVYYRSPSPTDKSWNIGEEIISVSTVKRKYSSFYLFHTGTVDYYSDYGYSTLWWVKIYDGDILLYDLIPVRFTNENGETEGAMYDKVSGELFRNAGTGAFVLGSDI